MDGFFKKWFFRFYRLLVFFLFIIGFSGVPGDIDQWYVWVSAVVENPTIKMWAEFFFECAQFINEPKVRILLVVVGLLAIVWPMKRFLRLRYRFRIWGKSIMSEKVWVSQVEAVQEIRGSDWGELREPYVSENRSIFATSSFINRFGQNRTVSGMSPEKKVRRKFQIYLEATLRSFHKTNPEALRWSKGGKAETELNALRAFLQEAMDQQIFEEIGAIPRIKVT